MTWSWTILKFLGTTGLGMISNNPIGWVVGGTTSQVTKIYYNERLNSSDLTLSDKEVALRWVQVATDYQWGLALGIVGKGVGSVANKIANDIAKETAKIGKDAAKEIAKNGGKFTSLARSLITKGKHLAGKERILRAINDTTSYLVLKDVAVSITETSLEKLKNAKNEEEFLNEVAVAIEAQELLIEEIERRLEDRKELLNSVRRNLLDISKENVSVYIKNQKNTQQHREINKKINRLLKRVKANQRNLHRGNKCCSQCRFC